MLFSAFPIYDQPEFQENYDVFTNITTKDAVKTYED